MEYKCLKCGTINTNLKLGRNRSMSLSELVVEQIPYDTNDPYMTCEDDLLLALPDTEGNPQTKPTVFGSVPNIGCWLCGNVNQNKFKRIN